MAGCGGGSSPAVPAGAPDVLPPAAVSQFAATQGDGSITLTWSNPADADFQAVRVMRATDTVPVSAADGELLYTGADHAYLDTGLRHGQAYYYAAFAQDASGNFAAAATASATCAYKPFTFVAIPDTQYYSLDYPALFKTMTQWIVDYRREWNIRMVLHEGDITHKNTDSEWANAVAAITVMNNEVPYVLSIGNHDIPSSGDTAHFNEYFPGRRRPAQRRAPPAQGNRGRILRGPVRISQQSRAARANRGKLGCGRPRVPQTGPPPVHGK